MRDRARALRRNSTKAERVLWRCLRANQLGGFKFRRQQVVGPYIADFYCAAAQLIIETDGVTHDGRADYDERRTKYLEAEGYRVMRFFDREVLESTTAVLEEVLRVAQERVNAIKEPSPRPSPCEGEGVDCAPSWTARRLRTARCLQIAKQISNEISTHEASR